MKHKCLLHTVFLSRNLNFDDDKIIFFKGTKVINKVGLRQHF